jgi:hypothetical protein
MASKLGKQKFQNMILVTMQLHVGIPSVQKNKRLNLRKKMTKKWYECRGYPYQTHALAYNKEMDQLVVANIVSNEVDEEDVIGLDDKE